MRSDEAGGAGLLVGRIILVVHPRHLQRVLRLLVRLSRKHLEQPDALLRAVALFALVQLVLWRRGGVEDLADGEGRVQGGYEEMSPCGA